MQTNHNKEYRNTDNQKGRNMILYMGLNTQAIPTLYYSVDHPNLVKEVRHAEWILLLDELEAEPGEMLKVMLSRDIDKDV